MPRRPILLVLLLAAPVLRAQQQQTIQQTITVTASEPLPVTPDENARSLRLFDTADPATQPLFQSPVDYLRLDPSLDIQARGPAGVQTDISIRGTTFEQTLILVDGLRVNDPETGHLNFDLALPSEAISRIDVLHGSGSTFYGSDAIGGAVNLITFAPTIASATLRAGGGSYGQTEQNLIAGWLYKALAQRLTASRDTSDGFFYAGPTGFTDDRGYHSNAVALDTFFKSTEILLAGSDRPYGANLFYGAYPSAERTKGWFAAAIQQLPRSTSADFAFRRHTDEYILFVGQPAIYENNHHDSLWQADLRHRDLLGRHLTLDTGLEADGDAIQSTNLGRHARNQGAGYANLSTRALGRLTLTAGARLEVFAGPRPVFTPTAAAAYDLRHGLRAHAAAGRGFRLPTYVDLYYSDPTTIGNPTLKPETSQSYEAGLDLSAGRSRATVTGFTLRQANAIDYSKLSLAAPYQATNIGHLAYTGAETTYRYTVSATQQIDLGYTFIHAAPPPAGLISEYAYNYATSNGSLAWQAQLKPGLAARTQVSVVQQTGRTAYALWTVAATGTRGRVRPYIRLENLANTVYQELPGVPQPGRSIVGGFTFTTVAGK